MFSLGGKHIIRCVDRPGVTAPFIDRVPLLRPLLEAQSYIEPIECSEEPVDIDLVPFRRWHSSTTTLPMANAAEYQVQTGKPMRVDCSIPWMRVEPDKSFEGKVIIARSPRYNNLRMDWGAIVKHYGHKLIFVGLPDEHQNFQISFGEVPHLRVKDFMELARIIAGSSLCIMNQSSPQAVAMAVGANIIQEVDPAQPDCIFNRSNVQYVADGEMLLPDIAGSGKLYIPKVPDVPECFNTAMVPPNGWQYPKLPASYHFKIQRGLVAKLEGCPEPAAEKKLFRHNALMHPKFFLGTDSDPLHLFRIAMANAFPAEKRAFPEPSISI